MMTLKVYNTLSGKKEEFQPVNKNKVGIYACGITAYDSCHLGHARGAIAWDIVVRYLRFKGFDVTFVRNYTDVDDKIINRANKENKTCTEISEYYIKEYSENMASLGNASPDIEPKATEHIPEMIATIDKLIKNGYAYERDGNVFYSVRKFPGYGKLSGKKIDELEAGARIDVNETKDDPLDFALWKASKPNEPKWPSPWGEGRPGWHIECSAMSSKYLGQPFDIHGGGRDLVFPHHENEIAQAEGAEGKQFVKYWLHNGFLNINAEKMSKSLGNFMTIRDVMKKYGAETIRFFIISNHYRSPIDFTDKAMNEAATALDRFYETAKRMPKPEKNVRSAKTASAEEKYLAEKFSSTKKSIIEFMDDDFNTAGAIGTVFEMVRAVNKYLDTNPDRQGNFFQWAANEWFTLNNLWGDLFGLFNKNPEDYFNEKKSMSSGAKKIDPTLVEKLLIERKTARLSKNFKRADEIRKELSEMGIVIKDKPDGSTEWQVG